MCQRIGPPPHPRPPPLRQLLGRARQSVLAGATPARPRRTTPSTPARPSSPAPAQASSPIGHNYPVARGALLLQHSRCSPCGRQPARGVPPELSALDRLRTLLLRGQPARVAPARDRAARQARVPLHHLDQARRASRGAPAASRSCARRVPPTPSCAASCACRSRRPTAFRSMDDDKSGHVCAPESKEMVRSFNLEL